MPEGFRMKQLLKSGLVDEFWRAENQLLQALVTQFTLRRTESGAGLEVGFSEQTPTVWLRDGKTAVRYWMEKQTDHRKKVKRYQEEIDQFMDRGGGAEYVFDDPKFPFRYVSGGTLPVVRMGGTDYYALFYRDVFPIGWNLSNGSSDSREELLQPVEAIERELREELMVVAPRHKARYVFASEAGKTLERSEYAVARRLWGDRFATDGYPDFRKWNELTLPMKWMPGPDRLKVCLAGAKAEETSDCFISITTKDFGIEVDRVARMTIDEDAVLLDGEVYGSRLLNRPVGLFEVERMHAAVKAGETCILPDRYFYGVPPTGRKRSYRRHSEWSKHAEPALLADVRAIRPPRQVREFVNCRRKHDLCPVTKRMIRRLLDQFKREAGGASAPGRQVDGDTEVFISYGGEDRRFAEIVYRHVSDRLGRKAFFNVEELHHSHFRREIENALERCHWFVSVGSSISNLRREWPTYECQVFHNEILNGNKSASAQIISLVTGFDPRHLPLPQRAFHSIKFNPRNLTPAVEQLGRYLGAKS